MKGANWSSRFLRSVLEEASAAVAEPQVALGLGFREPQSTHYARWENFRSPSHTEAVATDNGWAADLPVHGLPLSLGSGDICSAFCAVNGRRRASLRARLSAPLLSALGRLGGDAGSELCCDGSHRASHLSVLGLTLIPRWLVTPRPISVTRGGGLTL